MATGLGSAWSLMLVASSEGLERHRASSMVSTCYLRAVSRALWEGRIIEGNDIG